jgi:chromosome segregation ATPase
MAKDRIGEILGMVESEGLDLSAAKLGLKRTLEDLGTVAKLYRVIERIGDLPYLQKEEAMLKEAVSKLQGAADNLRSEIAGLQKGKSAELEAVTAKIAAAQSKLAETEGKLTEILAKTDQAKADYEAFKQDVQKL